MKVEEATFFKDYIAMADDGDQRGWHEANGGNCTYWLTKGEVERIYDDLSFEGEWIDIEIQVAALANSYFLVSGTGKFFHNMKKDPATCTGIMQMNHTGNQYRICWGLRDGGRPTSELCTHLMNMEVKRKQTNGKNRVIYHCHCPNVIALTFLLPLESTIFTRELWEMMSECSILFPQGLGVMEWMVPGGIEIAKKTSALMETYNAVIWAHHGIFCSGVDFDATFGLLHAIEKSAEIWIKVHSCSMEKRQTIPVKGFQELAKVFHVSLDPKFLYQKEDPCKYL